MQPHAFRRKAHPVTSPHSFTQSRAEEFLGQIKAQSNITNICLERFSKTTFVEVQFWTLQTLHKVRFPNLLIVLSSCSDRSLRTRFERFCSF